MAEAWTLRAELPLEGSSLERHILDDAEMGITGSGGRAPSTIHIQGLPDRVDLEALGQFLTFTHTPVTM